MASEEVAQEEPDTKLLKTDPLDELIGRHPTFPREDLSPEGIVALEAWQPRPSDVIILTPPKTGTTWMQCLCHALRTRGELGDFDDIFQVVPWDHLAWDLGQDLDAEQPASPRLFKSHQRLGAVNRGAKYLCLVRGVEDVLCSWWRFLKEKDAPPLRDCHSIDDFVLVKGWFKDHMKWGASIWEYYTEFFKAMQMPNVLVLSYEDLVEDVAGHLPVIADFMGLPKDVATTPETVAKVLHHCSKEGMAAMSTRFDNSWTHKELVRVGRVPNPALFAPASRIHKASAKTKLGEELVQLLSDRWHEVVEKETGLQSYEALRQAVAGEVAKRRGLLS